MNELYIRWIVHCPMKYKDRDVELDCDSCEHKVEVKNDTYLICDYEEKEDDE